MKRVTNLFLISIFTLLVSCMGGKQETADNNSDNNKHETDSIIQDEKAVEDDEKARMSITSINSSALVVNVENSILVNISSVEPRYTWIEVKGEKIIGNEYGLFSITPKEIGLLDVVVLCEIDGREQFFGKVSFNVVSPKTTIGEIFEMN